MSVHVKNPLFKSTFIHTPKTGGESISAWLHDNVGSSWRKDEKHYHYGEMKKKYRDLGFTYGVVRNPWDRIVSGYHYYKGKNATILRKKKNPIRNFEQFIKSENFGETLEKPQWKFVPPGKVDLIIRFENLEEDFKQVQEFYNKPIPLPHRNQSVHTHYSEYYTEQWMIDIVEKHFHQDIKFFKYEFTYK